MVKTNGPRDYHTEWSQKEKKQVSHINTLVWNLARRYRWTCLQGQNQHTDIENKRMGTKGGKGVGVMNWKIGIDIYTLSSVQLLSHVRLFVTPRIATRQASLFITNSCSPPKPMSIELVMPSNHLILCRPLLLLLSIFPNIRVFSNESALHIRWPKYWSFSFTISPTNEHWGLISFRMDWLDLVAVQGTL